MAALQAEKFLSLLDGDDEDWTRESLAVLIETHVKLGEMAAVKDLCLRAEGGLMRRPIEGLGGSRLENLVGQYLQ